MSLEQSNPNKHGFDILSRPQESEHLYSFDSIDNRLLSRVGGKGANLVLLKRAGLPVPDGYCIPTNIHEYYIENSKLPDNLVAKITEAKNRLGGKIAIRSSANCEDGTDLSMTGVFQSHYVVENEEIEQVVIDIFEQAHSSEVEKFMSLHGISVENVKMGLVIQELIEPDVAGVIYTGVNGDDLLIQYVDGFGAKLVDGETQGSTILASKDNTILQSTGFETIPLPPNVINQLSGYSRTIENLFHGIPQDIEFAYKDGAVYILQARTLTADLGKVDLRESPEDTLEATKLKLRQLISKEKQELGTPTTIFSDANYSELLPKPTAMDIGIHMYVWGGSDEIPGAKQLGHAAMGYLVGKESIPIISYIGGRTYFSIARNAGVYHVGFPETTQEYYATLVHEYLDAVQKDPEKGEYPQMGLYLQDPTLKDLQIRFGDRAQEYFQVYQLFVTRMRGFADEYLSEFHSQRLPETTRFVQKLQETNLQSMTNQQLADYAIGILEHNRTMS
ncbi:MAG: PEP/pyruvate-binding domain-containing protein, partial [Patescibacteria group bacterium]